MIGRIQLAGSTQSFTFSYIVGFNKILEKTVMNLCVDSLNSPDQTCLVFLTSFNKAFRGNSQTM